MRETATHHPEKVLSIAQNVARVQERIRQAALRVGRDPASVRLVAASKTVDAARIRAAIAAGVTILGENYLQEARDKIGQLGRHRVEWHLIGTLQRNKVRYMFDLFDMMHSLDSMALAEEINRRGARLGRHMPVLLEVNVGGELTKSGFDAPTLLAEAHKLSQFKHLQVLGLMTIPPRHCIPKAPGRFIARSANCVSTWCNRRSRGWNGVSSPWA
jgi:pyridoxal phosphate enzyme (YggS family)